jgi:CubicO group peptidase (beta-lactamase class C family)
MPFRCDSEARARVRAAFEDNFSRGAECGAALSVWQDGLEVFHFEGGFADRTGRTRWTDDTAVLVWSATKGPASACVLHALAAAGISMDEPVSPVWPEFAAGGKAAITFRQVLSHQAGLAALPVQGIPAVEHPAVASAVAAMRPAWEPGSDPGYSPRLFGSILDEICRRLSNRPLGDYWQTHFAKPFGIDFGIGLPPGHDGPVADILSPRAVASHGERTAFERAFSEAGSLTQAAFSTPSGNFAAAAMNRPAMRTTAFPAFGGIGTARALAKFYALAMDADGPFGNCILQAVNRRDAQGLDRVLLLETAFAGGFMLDPLHNGLKIRRTFGPEPTAFGHPGAGGSLGFADPANKIAFAYVMNQMEHGALPRQRTLRLVQAFYGR